VAQSTDTLAAYVRELKSAALEALYEGAVLISVEQVYLVVWLQRRRRTILDQTRHERFYS
jgi:hypothetical protein